MSDQITLSLLRKLLESPTESATLDFKEILDLSRSRDRVEFAKDVLAMANTAGGHIIVGVEDSTRQKVGLVEALQVHLREPKDINDKLRKYTGGYITVASALHRLDDENASPTLAIIYVPRAAFKINAHDDGVYQDPANPDKQKWVFRKGDVYVRKGDASVKVETPADLWVAPALLDPTSAQRTVDQCSERFSEALARELPPILPNESADEVCGQNLIGKLLGPQDYLVLGSSGLGKSVHLRQLCLGALRQQRVPIFAACKHYRGGLLFDLLEFEAKRFSTAEVPVLLEAAELERRPVILVLDGLNEAEGYVRELFREIEALKLRFPLRVVLSSQTEDLPIENLRPEVVVLTPLSKSHKRFIYCHNAEMVLSDKVDHFCAGFSNGYDLALAGRCHRSTSHGLTRVELYERYCRRALPQHTSVSEALARELAGRMAGELTTFLPRHEFERHSEQFMADHDSPLTVLDQFKGSRLVRLTDDTFSFEHDLLFDYLRAEGVRRKPGPLDMGELAKPKNQSLIAFLMPRFADEPILRTMLGLISNSRAYREVFAGYCGEAARRLLISDCSALIELGISDLPNTTMNWGSDELRETLPIFSLKLTGGHAWTDYELRLMDAMTVGLDIPVLLNKFLQLLKMTEWHLGEISASDSQGNRAGSVWATIVGQLGLVKQQDILLFQVASRLRDRAMDERHANRDPLLEGLWGEGHKEPSSHFAIAILLEQYVGPKSSDDLTVDFVELIRRAWSTKIYHLRLNTLHLLHQSHWRLELYRPDLLPPVRELLSSLSCKNIMLGSVLVEVQVLYDIIHPSFEEGQIVGEMRQVLTDSVNAPVADQSRISEVAIGLIANMFEDVFEGAYVVAFESLSQSEQVSLLCLAARSDRRSFHKVWILNRLLEMGDESALPVFRKYASHIDTKSNAPHEAAGAFGLGIAGCARFGSALAPFVGLATSEHQAWEIIGQILFLTCRGRFTDVWDHEGISKLWLRLRNRAPLAAMDALYRLSSGLHVAFEGPATDSFDLISKWGTYCESLLTDGLARRDQLTSVFDFGGAKDTALVRFIIESLGKVGGTSSIPALKQIADDQTYGDLAILAIHKIRSRSAQS